MGAVPFSAPVPPTPSARLIAVLRLFSGTGYHPTRTVPVREALKRGSTVCRQQGT